MKFLDWAVSELGQSSTYAVAAVFLGAAGVKINPGYVQDAMLVGMAASGIAAVIIKEGWQTALKDGDLVNAVEQAVASVRPTATPATPATPAAQPAQASVTPATSGVPVGPTVGSATVATTVAPETSTTSTTLTTLTTPTTPTTPTT
jgi:hypothetical protein